MRACLSWNYGLQGANARASVLTIVRHTAENVLIGNNGRMYVPRHGGGRGRSEDK
jgi:hypothetical protein